MFRDFGRVGCLELAWCRAPELTQGVKREQNPETWHESNTISIGDSGIEV